MICLGFFIVVTLIDLAAVGPTEREFSCGQGAERGQAFRLGIDQEIFVFPGIHLCLRRIGAESGRPTDQLHLPLCVLLTKYPGSIAVLPAQSHGIDNDGHVSTSMMMIDDPSLPPYCRAPDTPLNVIVPALAPPILALNVVALIVPATMVWANTAWHKVSS